MTDSDLAPSPPTAAPSTAQARPVAAPTAPRLTTRDAKTVGRAIRYGTVLRPWMRAYAEWLMLETNPRTTQHMRALKARELSRLPVSRRALADLEAREDFQAYCGELQAGPLEVARTRFASRFPEYVEAHFEALQQAKADGDYRAVAQITEPVLDRVYPKKGEAAVAATQVNITLTPEQAVGFDVEYAAPVVEVEAPAPPAEPA